MNQSPDQNPTDPDLLKEAAQDEQSAMTAYLQNRVVMLNAEVRRRDQIILDLETQLAILSTEVPPMPEGFLEDPDDGSTDES